MATVKLDVEDRVLDRIRKLLRLASDARGNWHEGVVIACGHVIVAAWKALGLPTAAQCAVGFCRLAWEVGRAMLT
jgi:hypothetical protein